MDTNFGNFTTLDVALTTSHTVIIAALLPGTTYYYRILSADANGFFYPSENMTFTTLSLPAQPPPSEGTVSTSSGSGGGGTTFSIGSAGIGSALSTPVDAVTLSVATLSADTPVTRNAPSNFPIRSITIQSSFPVRDVSISIKKINSANIPTPPGTIYNFVRIDAINADNLSYIETEFDVPRSWMDENQFSVDHIRLLRYSTSWERMPTYYVSDNSAFYRFKAVLPGFSVFAVVGEREIINQTQQETKENITKKEEGPLSPLVSSKSEFSLPMQFFIISGVMFLVALLLYLHHHRYPKKQPPPLRWPTKEETYGSQLLEEEENKKKEEDK
jgi:PGF-pre-PGF domain-containing protein